MLFTWRHEDEYESIDGSVTRADTVYRVRVPDLKQANLDARCRVLLSCFCFWKVNNGLPRLTRFQKFWNDFDHQSWSHLGPVSYTHLTLPTIYSV